MNRSGPLLLNCVLPVGLGFSKQSAFYGLLHAYVDVTLGFLLPLYVTVHHVTMSALKMEINRPRTPLLKAGGERGSEHRYAEVPWIRSDFGVCGSSLVATVDISPLWISKPHFGLASLCMYMSRASCHSLETIPFIA